MDVPSIPQFFAGRCIFVTGATGFMGKVLVEKLLRSCPNLETIYLLMRPKKGRSVDERLVALKNSAIFTRIKEERPEALEGTQLLAVAGDVNERGLGLSLQDRELLAKKVSVVFHSAATVRFDDPIRRAVRLNTGGTYEMIQLAEQMKNLLAFVYVSTTYCNTNRHVIDEAVYPTSVNWRTMLKMLDHFDDDVLNILTPKLLGKLPNTYSFSKGLSEDCIYEHKSTVPSVIYRPSVVCSSMREPVPGWIDNLNGPAGLLVACGKGLVHSTLCNTNKIMDFSPVDVAIKGMIVAAWKNAVEKMMAAKMKVVDGPEPEIPEKEDGRRPDYSTVYNCATSSIRPISMGFVCTVATTLAMEVPLNDVLWFPTAVCTTNVVYHYIVTLFLQILPAVVIDTALRLSGKPPRLLKIQRRIWRANEAIRYYLNNEWKFPNEKFIALQNYTSNEDKVLFGSDVWEENEYEYFRDCIVGARKYLLMEPEDTLPAAKRHMLRVYWLDRILRVAVCGLCAYFILRYFGFLGYASPSLEALSTE